jgi:hypothetical protein
MSESVCKICKLKIRPGDDKRRDSIHRAYDPSHEPKWERS